MSKKYICPVCGFSDLKEPPYDKENLPSYEICPCCGFEFGFNGDKAQNTYDVFRTQWINNGANWFLPNRKPAYWDLQKQLENLKRKA